jgi:hypothetical protein
MNKEKDEDLDKLFRKRLEDPVNEPAFRDADWDAMEQMLDKGKKRPAIIYWLPVLGSVAALLLLFIGYMFLKTDVVKPVKQQQMSASHQEHANPAGNTTVKKKDNTGTSGEPSRQAADISKQQTLNTAKYAGNQAVKRHGKKSKSFFTLSSGEDRRIATGRVSDNNAETIAASTAPKTVQPGISSNQPPVVNNQPATINDQAIANNNVPEKKDIGVPTDQKDLGTADNSVTNPVVSKQKDSDAANTLASATEVAPDKTKVISPKRPGSRPQFAFGILASSDLNGVNSSFQQSKIGSNFGATFSVTFAKKWTISTGAVYAIKPYLTNFDNYHSTYQFGTDPTSVYANCRMLDIPLNINYQVYHLQANSITLGTGLSSYFMLREDYRFNYASSYSANWPTGYSVINKNHNILSVLNLDATYTHQINSKFGVTVQPYLKVPLADVGASQVRLQTTGVALGFSWNINASSKPK